MGERGLRGPDLIHLKTPLIPATGRGGLTIRRLNLKDWPRPGIRKKAKENVSLSHGFSDHTGVIIRNLLWIREEESFFLGGEWYAQP